MLQGVECFLVVTACSNTLEFQCLQPWKIRYYRKSHSSSENTVYSTVVGKYRFDLLIGGVVALADKHKKSTYFLFAAGKSLAIEE